MVTKPSTPEQLARNRKLVFGAAVFIVAAIALSSFFGRLSPEAQAGREFLRTLPVDRITEIRLQPYSVLSLVKDELVITDRRQIEQIAAELRDAPPVGLNHPEAKWVAILRIIAVDGEYGGQVESTANQGVIMMFASDVQGGWNYGAVRRDSLGPLLESLAQGS